MFKKLGMIILSVTMFFPLIPTSTFAANVKDKTFSFNLNTSAKTTAGRAKENTSSTYVHLEKSPTLFTSTQVQGLRPTGSTGTTYWRNETIGGTVALKKGQWLIRQLVYENGGRSARLRMLKNDRNSTVSGVWSPDSVGSYPIVN